MKNLSFVLILIILSACNPYKSAENQLNKGNYSQAFETSVKVFQKNSSQKKKDKQLILLQNSYLKANEEDENDYELANRKSEYKKAYYALLSLNKRHKTIKPLLPLSHNGKELKFPIKDYSEQIAIAKEKYLNQYYTTALNLLETNDKYKAREAYTLFKEVREIDRYYRGVMQLEKEAYEMGINMIYITTENKTGVPFPLDFKNNFLNSLKSSNFWTGVTANKINNYDYKINVVFRQAFVGNDIVTTNQYNYEKEFVDGWEYLKDRRGVIIKDSLGKGIKVDRYVKANAQITEYIRHKEAMLSADVQVYNSAGSMINTYPIASNFAFNASFATLKGDERALDEDVLIMVNTAPIPFPNNYDMITECGKDLKNKLTNILNSFD